MEKIEILKVDLNVYKTIFICFFFILFNIVIFININLFVMDLTPSPFKLLEATLIIAGLWVDSKLFWMLVYEIKYGKGDEYLNGSFKRKKEV